MAGITLREKDMVIHIHVPDGETFFYVDGKRIYMSFHDYCGPSFYHDQYHNTQIDYEKYEDENHELWVKFGKWYRKYQKAKDKRMKAYEDSRNRSSWVHRNEPVQLALELRPRRPRSGQPERRL
jgi:hypothetical protein